MSTAVRTVDVASIINQRRLTGFNYGLIALSWLITVFDGFDMMMVSFTAPYMRDQFALSKTMLGYVFSAGLVGMMLGGFVFSFLADRIGRRPTVVLAAFTFGILTTATGFADSYHALLVLRFVDGFAIGGMLPLAWALNIEFVPVRMRSTIVTIIMMGYSFGTAVAGPMTNWIAPKYGWQGVYFAGGVGTLMCATALWIRLPESIRFLVTKGLKPELVAKILKRLDPASDVTAADHFVLSDERKVERQFHVGDLFLGRLALITPLLWVGYIASSLAIYFAASWGPIVLESLKFPRDTSALVASLGGLMGAVAGLALMRFTDRLGPRAVAFYPALAIPVLLMQGLGAIPVGLFLSANVLGAMLVSGAHFGVLSIAGIFYPSAIRASGAGWATSVAKIGAILGPIIGAAVLSSGLPVIRSYALLAVCPAVLFCCALGIHFAARARGQPSPAVEPAGVDACRDEGAARVHTGPGKA
jgi:AAHS family 4-hydroxybenzoate transporter-like MFS transporter